MMSRTPTSTSTSTNRCYNRAMRLYLSSQDLGNYASVAYEMCGSGKRVACVLNAADGGLAEDRANSRQRKQLMFEEKGFAFEELDLREYFGLQSELEARLEKVDFVWCNGGNTFILRRAMRASGLDELLIDWLQKDKIMYGGSSAGSCVCGPSLRGLEYGDRSEPEAVPESYPFKETIWEGLSVVPFAIVPHVDQEWFKADAQAAIRQLKATATVYQPLNDGQVVIVDGTNTEVLG